MTFHVGEIAVQTRVGVREEAEQLRGMINPKIKPAAQMLLVTQQLAIASTVDTSGNVWASLLTGQPSFIRILDPQTIEIEPDSVPDALYRHLEQNSELGLLVIDLTTRKRLRLNGLAEVGAAGQILLQTREVFFNCPKYIQTRHLETDTLKSLSTAQTKATKVLIAVQQDWIAHSDTFFIASFNPETGADASHRGGYRGFIRLLNDRTLLFPDYAGNNMFQTLGNLIVNPRSGLLFIDFEQGNTLQLTGTAEVIWDESRLVDFAGAQRLVEFHLDQVLETTNATPRRWRFGDYSLTH